MPPRPQSYDSMLWIAERLGQEFRFVRVDLYDVDGEVYVGELTFTPTAGLHLFDPPETDLCWAHCGASRGGPATPAAPFPEYVPARDAVSIER